MIKSIQRFLESFADFISRGVKDLVDLINKSLRRSKTARSVCDRRSCLPSRT